LPENVISQSLVSTFCRHLKTSLFTSESLIRTSLSELSNLEIFLLLRLLWTLDWFSCGTL